METVAKKPMTHWKKLTNPNYLGSYALEPGEEKVLTIKSVGKEEVKGPDGKSEELIVCHFQENEKPMILNATNCKIISKIYKTPYIQDWPGKAIRIYTAQVRAFGDTVDALRIRSAIPQTEKKRINAERFGKMLDQIKRGNYTAEKARATFTLTKAQNEQLNSVAQ